MLEFIHSHSHLLDNLNQNLGTIDVSDHGATFTDATGHATRHLSMIDDNHGVVTGPFHQTVEHVARSGHGWTLQDSHGMKTGEISQSGSHVNLKDKLGFVQARVDPMSGNIHDALNRHIGRITSR